jgi:hypothetical protein
MPFLNHGPVLQNNVKQLRSVPDSHPLMKHPSPALPPKQTLMPRKAVDEASANRIDCVCENDRRGSGYRLQRRHSLARRGQDDVRLKRDQFRREFAIEVGIAPAPANINPHVLTFGPTQFLQALPERSNASLSFGVIRSRTHEHTDPRNLLALLRPHRDWPRR